RHRPVVLHVSALATVRDGAVYILPGHAAPDNPATWIKFDDALASFAAGAAPHKLLLLDVARPFAPDVAGRLDASLASPPAGVLVLTSCSPGEVALPMDEVQASAFAHYLAEGLTGAA